MTLTTWSRAFGMAGRGVAGAALVLGLAACKKDPSLAATKAECDQACAHAVGLNKGPRDDLTIACPDVCLELAWTVGEIACLNDAATYESVQGCAVVPTIAKVRKLVKVGEPEPAKDALPAQQQKEAEAKKLEAQLKEQNAKIERLLADLASAKSDAERAALVKQVEEVREATKRLGGTGSRAPAKACTCQPADPLCSCL